ncbi:ribonuclease P protein component [Flavonifractor hominis]|uniref:Ribonuclease P protein component n=1 Tax=Flavonifractor hominis TaxID=3133178 RepID=A0ABV1EPS3_9FIRM
MKQTIALKQNHLFRRLYGRGKNAVDPCLALYCQKNRLGYNRLGITVGVKLGKAVVRNRTRRRIREAYRLHEGQFASGYDLVVVARVRAGHSRYREIERSLLRLAGRLELLCVKEGQA